MSTDPMQRLERSLKIIVAMISLVGLSFIGLRIMASRSQLGLPNPRKECEQVGRVYDASTARCLPPGERLPASRS